MTYIFPANDAAGTVYVFAPALHWWEFITRRP
jgi:hypothetical protein